MVTVYVLKYGKNRTKYKYEMTLDSDWVKCSMTVILFFDCLLEGKGRL